MADADGESTFERFQRLARRLVQVPKQELDAKRANHPKRTRKDKKGR